MSLDTMLTFLIARVGTERFALDVSAVTEAVDGAGLERVAKQPKGALGFVRWRGALHTVWSPESVLRVAPQAASAVLVLRSEAGAVALAVDDVERVVTLPESAMVPLPGIDDGAGLVRGGVKVGDSLVTVVDSSMLATLIGRAAGGELRAL